MENVNAQIAVETAEAKEIDTLKDELVQLDLETFEIEELSDVDQHVAKSTSSTTSSTCCFQIH